MSGKPRKRSPATGKRKNAPTAASTAAAAASAAAAAAPAAAASSGHPHQPEATYLLECDAAMKQFILYLNDLKGNEHKKFIIQDLDSTHLLVKLTAKQEIETKVEDWLDLNVFSAVEKVGEDFDVS